MEPQKRVRARFYEAQWSSKRGEFPIFKLDAEYQSGGKVLVQVTFTKEHIFAADVERFLARIVRRNDFAALNLSAPSAIRRVKSSGDAELLQFDMKGTSGLSSQEEEVETLNLLAVLLNHPPIEHLRVFTECEIRISARGGKVWIPEGAYLQQRAIAKFGGRRFPESAALTSAATA